MSKLFTKIEMVMAQLVHYDHRPSKEERLKIQEKARCCRKTYYNGLERLYKKEDMLSITLLENKDLKVKLDFMYNFMAKKTHPINNNVITKKDQFLHATIKQELGYELSREQRELLEGYKDD